MLADKKDTEEQEELMRLHNAKHGKSGNKQSSSVELSPELAREYKEMLKEKK